MIKIIKFFICITLAALSAIIIAISGAFLHLSPNLPDVDILKDIQLQVPLRVYSADGLLIGEFGDKRRTPIQYKDVPEHFIHAFMAAEDDRFFDHPGVSIKGLTRALVNIVKGGSLQGGSTITMQVAKNYLLTSERKMIRKVREIFLSLQIEQNLSKEQILELYINKIFLGHRSYGIAAASQVYYGKPVQELSLAQIAMIAGLPKAPSYYNPIADPDRALERRNWILKRMLKLGYITQEEFDTAITEPVTAKKHQVAVDLHAPYIAEQVRQHMVDAYGEEAYTNGYKVITTIHSKLQQKAQDAVKKGLHDYDLRHGFRKQRHASGIETEEDKKALFQRIGDIGELKIALITAISDTEITAELRTGEQINITLESVQMKWKPYISVNRLGPEITSLTEILNLHDVIRVTQLEEGSWELNQLPAAEAALVSLSSKDGAILALVGGYDFYKSKFDRATQALRQVGSNIKPFIYAAALADSFTAASMINDAPVVIESSQLEDLWRPKNAGAFLGYIRLRQALYQSRNLVSVRILRTLGVRKAINYLVKFGFEKEKLPRDLSLALGSPAFTPLQVATAYSTFSNGGFKIEPYLIDAIYDHDGNILFKEQPYTACDKECEKTLASQADDEIPEIEEPDSLEEIAEKEETPTLKLAERIMDEQTVFIINSILKDVIIRGTATDARILKRKDIAGKTGTTNGPTDAWFSGYNPQIVTTTWVGFNDNSTLGNREYGGTAALPIWIDFMQTALEGLPDVESNPPEGIISVLIDRETGKRVQPGADNSMFEYIQEERLKSIEFQSTELNPEDSLDMEDIF